jgi:anaphase-promoting complex subunit 1
LFSVVISGLEVAKAQSPWDTPSCIYSWIEECLNSGVPSTFPLISNARIEGPASHKLIDQYALPRTVALTNCISKRYEAGFNEPLVVETMLQNSMNTNMIETLPEAIATILRSTLQAAMKRPSTTWPAPLLQLVRREDLLGLDQTHVSRKSLVATSDLKEVDARSLAMAAYEDSSQHNPNTSENDINLVHLFNDNRFTEIRDLLACSLQAVGEYKPRPGSSDRDFLNEQQAYVRLVYQRTLSKPAGWGLMTFGSWQPNPTEQLRMSAANPTCKVMPSGTVFCAEVPHENKVGWAYFHTGVAAALQIARDAQGLEASWIVLNKPTDPGVRHAGFLLGLGLNGHLKTIPRWLIFKYLTPKHDMTTIGLLLGASASRIGSMDQTITRLLSVHVPRLLPVGAAELNLSPLTQTAGLMSLGLLYYDTQHRRMSDILMSEIANQEQGHPINTNADTLSPKNEGYRLAAGYALGLINLGKGNNLRSLSGLGLEKRLLEIAVTPREVTVVHVLDQASAGAILALTFIFMKTNDHTMARKIAVPDTRAWIEHVRPDLLLLRALAQNIILWNEIQPTLSWIWTKLPAFLKIGYSPQTFMDARPLGTESLPFYNIITGMCWSIALKFAGTAHERARDCILTVYENLGSVLLARTYDERVAKETLLRCRHHLLLSASTIMAGSQDLKTFRLLREQYSIVTDDITFGLHQATTMAMGILFLGAGRCSFGASDFATAALTIAFYPLSHRKPRTIGFICKPSVISGPSLSSVGVS